MSTCVVHSPDAAVTSDDSKKIAQLRDRHWTMLVLSVGIIAAAFLLQVQSNGRVALKGFPDFMLPELCGSRLLFGIECPGCGLTRSFIALAHGDVAASLAYNRIGWIFAICVLLQVPYRIFSLWQLRTRVVERRWPRWFGYALIALLMLNWLTGGVVKSNSSPVPTQQASPILALVY